MQLPWLQFHDMDIEYDGECFDSLYVYYGDIMTVSRPRKIRPWELGSWSFPTHSIIDQVFYNRWLVGADSGSISICLHPGEVDAEALNPYTILSLRQLAYIIQFFPRFVLLFDLFRVN